MCVHAVILQNTESSLNRTVLFAGTGERGGSTGKNLFLSTVHFRRIKITFICHKSSKEKENPLSMLKRILCFIAAGIRKWILFIYQPDQVDSFSYL